MTNETQTTGYAGSLYITMNDVFPLRFAEHNKERLLGTVTEDVTAQRLWLFGWIIFTVLLRMSSLCMVMPSKVGAWDGKAPTHSGMATSCGPHYLQRFQAVAYPAHVR
jgi:hypothetical protein